MRIKKTIFLLALLFPFSIYAQNIDRCGTVEYWKNKKSGDPALAEKENQVRGVINEWLNSHSSDPERTGTSVTTIPVVVHVLWNTAEQNVSDQAIASQIDVINQDFSRTNSDASQTPSVWQSVAANPNIQFCFAKRTPAGEHTNGIERRYTSTTLWPTSDAMKRYVTGGLDVWDRDKYLNIWVCNLGGGTLGYTSLPGGDADVDGVVIMYSAFGKFESYLQPKYNLGRTTTHEIGHWLGLYHIWGDDSDLDGNCQSTECTLDDSIPDTPNQCDCHYSPPSFPNVTSCGNAPSGEMFMNYMDYTNDTGMNMFTNGQVAKMNAVLNSFRSPLMSSNGCTAVGIDEVDLSQFIQLYPNPADNEVFLDIHFSEIENLNITIRNLLGEGLLTREEKNISSRKIKFDVSSLPNGIYIMVLRTDNGRAFQKLNIIR